MAGNARTRYASDTDGMVCLLLDVRGQARPNSLQVYSYSKGKVVSLPMKFRNGRDLIRIETPDAKRWAAVSVPRWLINKEGLYGKPDLPPIVPGFCLQSAIDPRSAQQIRDDGERALAEYIVSRENKYRKLPGQRLAPGKADRRNGAIMA